MAEKTRKTFDEIAAQIPMVILSIRNEQRLGTRFFSAHGKKLELIRDILECLLRDGAIKLEPTKEREAEFPETVIRIHPRMQMDITITDDGDIDIQEGSKQIIQ
jgi:hypothetical protein